VELSDVPALGDFGGAWTTDGSIFFVAMSGGVWKVADSGGAAEQVTRLDRAAGETSHSHPQLVADGRVLIFTVATGWGWDEKRIEAQSLLTGERHVLVQGGARGVYLQPGFLVYHRSDKEELLAVPIDLDRLEPTGESVRLGEHVYSGGQEPQFAISEEGTLVYRSGGQGGIERRLITRDLDRDSVTPLPLGARAFMDSRLSPDGRRAALQILDATVGIWIYDLARGTLDPLTTRKSSSMFPVWATDGRRIAYTSIRNGLWGVYSMSVDGTGEEQELVPGAEGRQPLPGAWTPDGRQLLLQVMDANGSDLWTLDLETGKQERLFAEPSWECCFALSPDGRWLAYTSSTTGGFEVHLQAYPALGRRWQISRNGGGDPRWSPDGRRLYYFNGAKVMAVDLGTGSIPDPAPPRVLFEHGFVQTNEREWDLSPDGKRLLLLERSDEERPATQLHVVVGWLDELKRRFEP
jgi:Tol biopolymer transport system component